MGLKIPQLKVAMAPNVVYGLKYSTLSKNENEFTRTKYEIHKQRFTYSSMQHLEIM